MLSRSRIMRFCSAVAQNGAGGGGGANGEDVERRLPRKAQHRPIKVTPASNASPPPPPPPLPQKQRSVPWAATSLPSSSSSSDKATFNFFAAALPTEEDTTTAGGSCVSLIEFASTVLRRLIRSRGYDFCQVVERRSQQQGEDGVGAQQQQQREEEGAEEEHVISSFLVPIGSPCSSDNRSMKKNNTRIAVSCFTQPCPLMGLLTGMSDVALFLDNSARSVSSLIEQYQWQQSHQDETTTSSTPDSAAAAISLQQQQSLLLTQFTSQLYTEISKRLAVVTSDDALMRCRALQRNPLMRSMACVSIAKLLYKEVYSVEAQAKIVTKPDSNDKKTATRIVELTWKLPVSSKEVLKLEHGNEEEQAPPANEKEKEDGEGKPVTYVSHCHLVIPSSFFDSVGEAFQLLTTSLSFPFMGNPANSVFIETSLPALEKFMRSQLFAANRSVCSSSSFDAAELLTITTTSSAAPPPPPPLPRLPGKKIEKDAALLPSSVPFPADWVRLYRRHEAQQLHKISTMAAARDFTRNTHNCKVLLKEQECLHNLLFSMYGWQLVLNSRGTGILLEIPIPDNSSNNKDSAAEETDETDDVIHHTSRIVPLCDTTNFNARPSTAVLCDVLGSLMFPQRWKTLFAWNPNPPSLNDQTEGGKKQRKAAERRRPDEMYRAMCDFGDTKMQQEEGRLHSANHIGILQLLRQATRQQFSNLDKDNSEVQITERVTSPHSSDTGVASFLHPSNSMVTLGDDEEGEEGGGGGGGGASTRALASGDVEVEVAVVVVQRQQDADGMEDGNNDTLENDDPTDLRVESKQNGELVLDCLVDAYLKLLEHSNSNSSSKAAPVSTVFRSMLADAGPHKAMINNVRLQMVQSLAKLANVADNDDSDEETATARPYNSPTSFFEATAVPISMENVEAVVTELLRKRYGVDLELECKPHEEEGNAQCSIFLQSATNNSEPTTYSQPRQRDRILLASSVARSEQLSRRRACAALLFDYFPELHVEDGHLGEEAVIPPLATETKDKTETTKLDDDKLPLSLSQPDAFEEDPMVHVFSLSYVAKRLSEVGYTLTRRKIGTTLFQRYSSDCPAPVAPPELRTIDTFTVELECASTADSKEIFSSRAQSSDLFACFVTAALELLRKVNVHSSWQNNAIRSASEIQRLIVKNAAASSFRAENSLLLLLNVIGLQCPKFYYVRDFRKQNQPQQEQQQQQQQQQQDVVSDSKSGGNALPATSKDDEFDSLQDESLFLSLGDYDNEAQQQQQDQHGKHACELLLDLGFACCWLKDVRAHKVNQLRSFACKNTLLRLTRGYLSTNSPFVLSTPSSSKNDANSSPSAISTSSSSSSSPAGAVDVVSSKDILCAAGCVTLKAINRNVLFARFETRRASSQWRPLHHRQAQTWSGLLVLDSGSAFGIPESSSFLKAFERAMVLVLEAVRSHDTTSKARAASVAEPRSCPPLVRKPLTPIRPVASSVAVRMSAHDQLVKDACYAALSGDAMRNMVALTALTHNNLPTISKYVYKVLLGLLGPDCAPQMELVLAKDGRRVKAHVSVLLLIRQRSDDGDNSKNRKQYTTVLSRVASSTRLARSIIVSTPEWYACPFDAVFRTFIQTMNDFPLFCHPSYFDKAKATWKAQFDDRKKANAMIASCITGPLQVKEQQPLLQRLRGDMSVNASNNTVVAQWAAKRKEGDEVVVVAAEESIPPLAKAALHRPASKSLISYLCLQIQSVLDLSSDDSSIDIVLARIDGKCYIDADNANEAQWKVEGAHRTTMLVEEEGSVDWTVLVVANVVDAQTGEAKQRVLAAWKSHNLLRAICCAAGEAATRPIASARNRDPRSPVCPNDPARRKEAEEALLRDVVSKWFNPHDEIAHSGFFVPHAHLSVKVKGEGWYKLFAKLIRATGMGGLLAVRAVNDCTLPHKFLRRGIHLQVSSNDVTSVERDGTLVICEIRRFPTDGCKATDLMQTRILINWFLQGTPHFLSPYHGIPSDWETTIQHLPSNLLPKPATADTALKPPTGIHSQSQCSFMRLVDNAVRSFCFLSGAFRVSLVRHGSYSTQEEEEEESQNGLVPDEEIIIDTVYSPKRKKRTTPQFVWSAVCEEEEVQQPTSNLDKVEKGKKSAPLWSFESRKWQSKGLHTRPIDALLDLYHAILEQRRQQQEQERQQQQKNSGTEQGANVTAVSSFEEMDWHTLLRIANPMKTSIPPDQYVASICKAFSIPLDIETEEEDKKRNTWIARMTLSWHKWDAYEGTQVTESPQLNLPTTITVQAMAKAKKLAIQQCALEVLHKHLSSVFVPKNCSSCPTTSTAMGRTSATTLAMQAQDKLQWLDLYFRQAPTTREDDFVRSAKLVPLSAHVTKTTPKTSPPKTPLESVTQLYPSVASTTPQASRFVKRRRSNRRHRNNRQGCGEATDFIKHEAGEGDLDVLVGKGEKTLDVLDAEILSELASTHDKDSGCDEGAVTEAQVRRRADFINTSDDEDDDTDLIRGIYHENP